MKRLPIALLIVAAAISSLLSCSDEVTSVGSSLITDQAEVVIDSSFTLSGISVESEEIPSRTISQLLGDIQAEEYGSFSSDIVTQFMSAQSLQTDGVTSADIDSVKLMMFYTPSKVVGDSLVPMGLQVYPLTKQLPSPIYSNFDPTDYYDPSQCWTQGTQVYTGNALYSDSLSNLSYRSVAVTLPLEFGRKLFNQYLSNPSTFATPQSFTQFFPGLYIKNSFGSGRVLNFAETRINLYYKRHAKYTNSVGETRDTIYNVASTYLAVTPEVITNNVIRMELAQSLKAEAATDAVLVAPLGYDVRLTFPAIDIINRFNTQGGRQAVINALSLSLPVEEITNDYGIAPPPYLLMVLSKDKESFFASNKVNDDKTSFLATYNKTTKSYDFLGLRQYILNLTGKADITPDDYTFTLTPVNVTTEDSSTNYYGTSTSYVTAVTPYVNGPAMCKFDIANAKIKFTFSKQFAD